MQMKLRNTVSQGFVHALIIFCSAFTWSCQDHRPNILLILADDLGYSDLGCYGGEVSTTHLDGLAREGLRLTRFYSTGRCCPSRASILTGLYPHRAGLGHMVKDLGQPGYRGKVAEEAVTLAEVLQMAGYRSFISGKWHLGTPDPTKHGFEAFYGTLVSAQTFWDPGHFTSINEAGTGSFSQDQFHSKDQFHSPDPFHSRDHFYGTDALTDHALGFLTEARSTPGKPWFLYLAYNAPHFPLHAPQKDIARYADTYLAGWDEIREQRHARMKKLGIIPAETRLSPRSMYRDWGGEETGINPAWEDVPEDRQIDLARRMAIYAAMIEVMDRNIGRLMNDLAANGELENTMVIFTSDNGACAEWDPYGFDGRSGPNNILHTGEQLERMGEAGTYHSVGSGWANASNTPWRLYKHYNHEGGISVPCIIHWPAGMDRQGRINQQPVHLIDLMPTLIQVAAADYPSQIRGHRTPPLAGQSILPLLRGESLEARSLYFEHEGNRAVIKGRWKLTALREQEWELYDIERDRTELVNLAGQHHELRDELAREWDRWAGMNDVTPLPDDLGVAYLERAD